MATSGTYGFMMNRDQLIAAALRLTTVFGTGDVIPAADIADCAQSLNILAKELAISGLPLWCVQDYAIPMTPGQASYNISTLTGQTLPIRVLDAYLRDSTGNDVTLDITSRYDYDTLGQKASQGNPNQLYYDPQLTGGQVVLYNVPQDSTHTLHLVLQRQIQDFNLATDNPDFPQEAYRLLTWCLADEISLPYNAPRDVRLDIASRAKTLRDNFFAYEQEQASIQFTPGRRGQ